MIDVIGRICNHVKGTWIIRGAWSHERDVLVLLEELESSMEKMESIGMSDYQCRKCHGFYRNENHYHSTGHFLQASLFDVRVISDSESFLVSTPNSQTTRP